MFKFLFLTMLCGCAMADFALRETEKAIEMEEDLLNHAPCEIYERSMAGTQS